MPLMYRYPLANVCVYIDIRNIYTLHQTNQQGTQTKVIVYLFVTPDNVAENVNTYSQPTSVTMPRQYVIDKACLTEHCNLTNIRT